MQLRSQGLDLLASVVCRAEGRRKAEVRAGARHRKRRKVPNPMTKNDLQRTQGPFVSNGAWPMARTSERYELHPGRGTGGQEHREQIDPKRIKASARRQP